MRTKPHEACQQSIHIFLAILVTAIISMAVLIVLNDEHPAGGVVYVSPIK